MKHIAAIWHLPARPNGQPGGNFAVSIIDTMLVPGQAIGMGKQAVVVDVNRQIWNAPVNELEIVDDDLVASLHVAESRLSR